uniref:Putative ovule protein n=1 Tax=Solanum chacoense TaxID=4108 RepID=A0A0V0GXC3_SOLCH
MTNNIVNMSRNRSSWKCSNPLMSSTSNEYSFFRLFLSFQSLENLPICGSDQKCFVTYMVL